VDVIAAPHSARPRLTAETASRGIWTPQPMDPVAMPTFSYITFVAGPADVALAIVVVGTCVLALVLNILDLIAWLRRR
jgi:hypothetical protein